MSSSVFDLTIPPDAPIMSAMEAIDAGAVEIALVIDGNGKLLGTVTDGDIRRALLGGQDLSVPVSSIMQTRPQAVTPEHDRAAVLDLMTVRSLSQIPVVDGSGKLVGLHILREMLGVQQRPNHAVIMAGGRGTRLGSLTQRMPKPMLTVAGRPILERLVLHLVGAGIRQVHISVNYLAEVITEHFGDGSQFGCDINYLREDPDHPLGTAGSLGLIAETGHDPVDPLLVMNGDLVTNFAVGAMLSSHRSAAAVATMAVRVYSHQVPFGVVNVSDDGFVEELEEKPMLGWPVNAGIYVIEPSLLAGIPTDIEYPFTDLLNGCLSRGERVSVWQIDDEWEDVGRPAQLQQARGLA